MLEALKLDFHWTLRDPASELMMPEGRDASTRDS
jgi:hypothetical protein